MSQLGRFGLNSGMGFQGKVAAPSMHNGLKPDKPKQFRDMPSKWEWRSACYGRFYTSTSHDKILMDIERQIDEYPKVFKFYSKNRRQNAYPLVRALANIYTTTGYWIKENSVLTSKTQPRWPAIVGLQDCAAQILRKLFGITNPSQAHKVGEKVRGYLLKPLSDHGVMVDTEPRGPSDPQLKYLSDAETKSKQVFWRGGLAHQMDMVGTSAVMKKLDTSDWTISQGNQAHLMLENNGGLGVGGYAITYNKIVYSGMHLLSQAACFYHSSYLAGQPVVCAGAMTFVNGKLTYINNASGHYRPDAKQLYMALQTLRMFDVKFDDVVVDLFVDNKTDGVFKQYTYSDFMKEHRGF